MTKTTSEEEDDGCPKGDPDCLGDAEDCHDYCEEPIEPDDSAGYCAEPECTAQATDGDRCGFHAQEQRDAADSR